MKSGTKNLLYIGGALGALVILSNNAVGEGGTGGSAMIPPDLLGAFQTGGDPYNPSTNENISEPVTFDISPTIQTAQLLSGAGYTDVGLDYPARVGTPPEGLTGSAWYWQGLENILTPKTAGSFTDVGTILSPGDTGYLEKYDPTVKKGSVSTPSNGGGSSSAGWSYASTGTTSSGSSSSRSNTGGWF